MVRTVEKKTRRFPSLFYPIRSNRFAEINYHAFYQRLHSKKCKDMHAQSRHDSLRIGVLLCNFFLLSNPIGLKTDPPPFKKKKKKKNSQVQVPSLGLERHLDVVGPIVDVPRRDREREQLGLPRPDVDEANAPRGDPLGGVAPAPHRRRAWSRRVDGGVRPGPAREHQESDGGEDGVGDPARREARSGGRRRGGGRRKRRRRRR